MKLVIAVIRENKLEEVREALVKEEITRITVTRVAGHGQPEDIDLYRGREIAPALTSKVEMRIACNDDFVDRAVTAIMNSAKSSEQGEIGDGKIFIVPLEDCIRIRTGERGSSAI